MRRTSLFFSYLKEDLHRRFWVLLLSVYLSLTCVLDYALSLNGSRLFWGSPCLGPENPAWFLVSGVLAVLCAMQGFSYFLSETSCDFYLSLPLSRRQLLAAGYLNGCLTGLLPCILGRLTCLFVEGSLKSEAIHYTALGILITTIGFFLIYHAALAVLFLSGRISAALAGIVLLFAYGPAAFGFVFQTYGARFFQTWYQEDFIDAMAVYTSPLSLFRSLTGSRYAGSEDTWVFAEHRTAFFLSLLLLLLFLLLAVFLAEKRPAEACGKVLVFARAEFPVKLFLTVPAALLCGCYVMRASLDGRSLLWLFLGIVCGVCTVHGCLESFFRFDIHVFFTRKRQALCILAAACLIAANYYFDWQGYDSYTPDPQTLSAVSVVPSGLDDSSWQSHFDQSAGIPLSGENADRLYSAAFTGETMDAALKWVASLQEENSSFSSSDAKTPIAYAAAAYMQKNGRTAYRKYPIYLPEQLEAFSSVYDTAGYKEAVLPLFSASSAGRSHFVWSNGVDSYHLYLSEDETDALLSDWQKDAARLSVRMLKESFPVGTLSLSDGNYSGSDPALLYPEFTKTLDLLETFGIPARSTLAGDYEIYGILLYEIRESVGIRQTEHKKILLEDIRDPEEIKRLQPWLLSSEFAVNPILHPVDPRFEATVLCRDSSGQTFRYLSAFLKTGSPAEDLTDPESAEE